MAEVLGFGATHWLWLSGIADNLFAVYRGVPVNPEHPQGFAERAHDAPRLDHSAVELFRVGRLSLRSR
ncbi:hypothetical protein [Kutzneria kofuensis]|uniref:Uncharacterized protein n=1 Tax=Kutzneria kofuensis TaxID=103725 RepID=A0A7W9KFB9_9PSEU|nr:hypothetical protein [Kutzneria kofuensis]MBB5891370.1 hypothetical protein [Kutzneria kofuensis]